MVDEDVNDFRSLGDLESERDNLELAIADIKTDIERAQATARSTGEYADSDWFNRARAALRYKGIEYNRILREIKDARKVETADKDRVWEQTFIKVAKRTLTEDVYDRLVAETWDEVGGRP